MTNALATQGAAVKRASIELAQASNETRQAVLLHVASRLEEVQDELLALNAERHREEVAAGLVTSKSKKTGAEADEEAEWGERSEGDGEDDESVDAGWVFFECDL